MWDSFIIACAACAVFLVVPGLLLFRGVGFRTSFAIAMAPVLSVAAFPVLGILFDKAGIASSWFAMFGIVLGIGVAAFVAGAIASSIRGCGFLRIRRSGEEAGNARREWLSFLLYLACGTGATFLVFVLNLDGADSFVQEYDNVHHLALIQTFSETGNWSSLTSSFYSASDPASVNPTPTSEFYPAGWHCLAAMLVGCCNIPATVAANTVNTVFCAMVYPMGMWLLTRRLFRDDFKSVVAGAFCCFAFAAFPWKLMAWGPIFPNFAALCFFPVLATTFMGAFEEGVSRGDRIRSAFGFVVCLASVALMQPNVAFTAAVFLVPFCVASIYRWSIRRYGGLGTARARRKGLVLVAAFLVFSAVLWCALYKAPPLRSLVSFTWPSFAGFAQAIVNVLTLSFRETPAQILLGLCVVSGAFLLAKRRENAWLIASYLIMCAMYVVNASMDGLIKQVLTGFWYADPMRIAANAALFAIPLASAGVAGVASFLGKAIAGALSEERCSADVSRRWGVAVGAVMLVCVFYPSYSISGWLDASTAFGQTRDFISSSYSASRDNVLNPEEKDFLEQVSEVVPEGAVVLNEPNDGSAFGYGLYGIDMYYRCTDKYDRDNETDASVTIRKELDGIASDEKIRSAVDEVGAQYVLQLDQGDFDRKNRYLFSYYPEQWTGIDAINDQTPGFEVVLSEGDMRLYRIV